MYVGKQQTVLMIGTFYFNIPKNIHGIHLATRNYFVFIFFNRIEHGAISKIPYYQFYRKHTNTENLPCKIN